VELLCSELTLFGVNNEPGSVGPNAVAVNASPGNSAAGSSSDSRCPLLDRPDSGGNTALHLAARYGKLAAAAELLRNGAKVDVKVRLNIHGNQPFNATHRTCAE